MLQNQWHVFCCPFYCSLTLHNVPFISLVTQHILFYFILCRSCGAVIIAKGPFYSPSNATQVHQFVWLLSKIHVLSFLILLTLLTLLNRYIAQ